MIFTAANFINFVLLNDGCDNTLIDMIKKTKLCLNVPVKHFITISLKNEVTRSGVNLILIYFNIIFFIYLLFGHVSQLYFFIY